MQRFLSVTIALQGQG